MKHDEQHEAPLSGGRAAPAKKPYRTPELNEYGDMAKLTQSGGLTTADSILFSRRRV